MINIVTVIAIVKKQHSICFQQPGKQQYQKKRERKHRGRAGKPEDHEPEDLTSQGKTPHSSWYICMHVHVSVRKICTLAFAEMQIQRAKSKKLKWTWNKTDADRFD